LIDFIQIGFNKTGTTLFEKVIYAQNSNVSCLQVAHYPDIANLFLKKVIFVESFCDYDNGAIEKIRKEFYNLYEKYQTESEAGVNGIMFEPFTFLYTCAFDRRIVIDRLCKLFPGVKIILTIRNQKTWFVSHYSQCVKAGVYLKFDEFMLLQMKSPALDARFVDWFPLVEYLVRTFGEEKVKILLFEDLKNDLQRCADTVYEFLGVRLCNIKQTIVNPSLSKYSLGIIRVVNRFVRRDYGDSPYSYKRDKLYHNHYAYRPLLKLGVFFYFAYRWGLLGLFSQIEKIFKTNKKYILGEDIVQLMNERYSGNNKKLSKLLDVELSKYDYP